MNNQKDIEEVKKPAKISDGELHDLVNFFLTSFQGDYIIIQQALVNSIFEEKCVKIKDIKSKDELENILSVSIPDNVASVRRLEEFKLQLEKTLGETQENNKAQDVEEKKMNLIIHKIEKNEWRIDGCIRPTILAKIVKECPNFITFKVRKACANLDDKN